MAKWLREAAFASSNARVALGVVARGWFRIAIWKHLPFSNNAWEIASPEKFQEGPGTVMEEAEENADSSCLSSMAAGIQKTQYSKYIQAGQLHRLCCCPPRSVHMLISLHVPQVTPLHLSDEISTWNAVKWLVYLTVTNIFNLDRSIVSENQHH